VGFLRRLFSGDDSGAGESESGESESGEAESAPAPAPLDAVTLDEEERARELELARFDQERVSELVRRQQRYAERSWMPPPQGGDRRADDEDAAEA
jgi:hypothetical protein